MFGFSKLLQDFGKKAENILGYPDQQPCGAFDLNLKNEPIKKIVKSSENFGLYKEKQQQEKVKNIAHTKQYSNQDRLWQSRMRSQSSSQVNLKYLKSNRKQALQDFKKELSQSLAEYQTQKSSSDPSEMKNSGKFKQINDEYKLVLSKIEQLSEQYFEYSMRKQEFIKRNNNSQNIENQKSISCSRIKSIAKPIIIEAGSEKNCFQAIDQDRLLGKKLIIQNKGSKNSANNQNFEASETAFELIKNFFCSLGLVEKQKQLNSLQDIVKSAKQNFNFLKSNDYISKLHDALQSVESMTEKDRIALVSNGKIDQKKQKTRKQILIKKEESKKVKLVTPQTCSELELRRNTINRQISSALQLLTSSRKVKKFAFYSTKITQVYLNFSMDFKFLSYKQVQTPFFTKSYIFHLIRSLCSCSALQSNPEDDSNNQNKSNKNTILSLNWNLVNVSKGIKTKNFIKYEEFFSNDSSKKDQMLSEDRCMSLLFKNRTYDLEFESSKIRDEYFNAIKIMIKSSVDL